MKKELKELLPEDTSKVIDNIELYFIQFLFMKNRELLKQENREIYDVLLNKYIEVYLAGKEHQMDLMEIEKKFLLDFGIKK